MLGADGIKSAVRGVVTEDDPNNVVTYSNTMCYRGLVPVETMKAADVKTDFLRRPTWFCGRDKVRSLAYEFNTRLSCNLSKHIVAFPLKAGTLVSSALSRYSS